MDSNRFGIAYAMMAFLIALLLVIFLGIDHHVFLVTAPVSAFMTGWPLWELIVNRTPSVIRISVA